MYLWFLAAFTAYLVKGLCGFANTLVFTTILSFGAANANISPVDLLLSFPANLVLAWKNRRRLDPKICLPLSILMLLGSIPGALLLLAFAVLQLVRMVRFYFAAPEIAEPTDKVLVVFLAVLLLYGMAEVLLSRLVGFASLSFLIVSGIFTEIERSAFQK